MANHHTAGVSTRRLSPSGSLVKGKLGVVSTLASRAISRYSLFSWDNFVNSRNGREDKAMKKYQIIYADQIKGGNNGKI